MQQFCREKYIFVLDMKCLKHFAVQLKSLDILKFQLLHYCSYFVPRDTVT